MKVIVRRSCLINYKIVSVHTTEVKIYAKKNIWISGVTGFTGRYLAEFIKRNSPNCNVVGLGRSSSPGVAALDEYYQSDLATDAIENSLASLAPPDIVFHLAAVLPPKSDSLMWQVNVGGTLRLIKFLASFNKPGIRFVNIGSVAEYLVKADGYYTETDPSGGMTTYGQSKWAQSEVAFRAGREWGVSIISTRTFNLIGVGLPAKYLTATICQQFADPAITQLKLGDIRAVRDFVDVDDAVRAYWELALKGIPGEMYNVCSGVETTIEDLITISGNITDRKLAVVSEESRFRREDVNRVYGDNNKINTLVGWKPQISLEQALSKVIKAERSTQLVSPAIL